MVGKTVCYKSFGRPVPYHPPAGPYGRSGKPHQKSPESFSCKAWKRAFQWRNRQRSGNVWKAGYRADAVFRWYGILRDTGRRWRRLKFRRFCGRWFQCFHRGKSRKRLFKRRDRTDAPGVESKGKGSDHLEIWSWKRPSPDTGRSRKALQSYQRAYQADCDSSA